MANNSGQKVKRTTHAPAEADKVPADEQHNFL
jgi:hypothetical protein